VPVPAPVAAPAADAPKPARTRKAAPVAESVPVPVAEAVPAAPAADKSRPRKAAPAPQPAPVVVPPAASRKKPAAAAPAPAPAAPRKIAAAARPEQLRQTSMFGEDRAAPVDRDVKAAVDTAAARRAARKAPQAPLRQAS
jgi:hypothetical protein